MEIFLRIEGCDDSTEALLNIDEIELGFLKIVAASMTQNSKYPCQPVMKILNVKVCPECNEKYPEDDKQHKFHCGLGYDINES